MTPTTNVVEPVKRGASKIEIDGTYNFRDSGIGSTMRRGFIYRSDNVKVATENGMSQISDLGIRYLIDLRSVEERKKKGNAVVPDHIMDLHYPLLMGDSSETFSNTAIQFLTFLIKGPKGYCELFMSLCDNVFLVKAQWLPIFELLGSSDSIDPIVLYCATGKDRTGLLVALLQLLGGADHQLIINDFALTAKFLPQIDLDVTLLRSIVPDINKIVTVMNPSDLELRRIFAAEPKSMELFLKAFHQKYRTIDDFFLNKIGLPKRQLEQMKRNLRVQESDGEAVRTVLSRL